MANIKDVAKKAGVSIGTVSSVINNRLRVKKSTKDRVIQVIKELSYQPNFSARNLKLKQTKTIGIILKNVTSPYYDEFFNGIQNELRKMNYDLNAHIIFDGNELQVLEKLICQKRVDGAIVFGANFIENDDLIHLDQFNIPIILFDRRPIVDCEVKNISTININNFKGAYLAAEHLILSGYSKIAYLGGSEYSFDNTERFKGFQFALKTYNIEFNPKWVLNGEFSEAASYEAMTQFLDQNKNPDAVLCANDQMAIGALRAIKERKMKVPDDIAVIGFDDIQLASIVEPALSTINYNRYKMGQMAIQILFEMIQKKEITKVNTIDTKMVIRQSTMRSLLD